MMDPKKIEELEKKYLDYIETSIEQNINTIMDGLDSRLSILDDWREPFLSTARKSYSATDLDTGAERIFHHVLAPIFRNPNSTPIGSDLVYTAHDAVIHIDVKTVSYSNLGDFKGKIQIGRNQTSYAGGNGFRPNLPTQYGTNGPVTLTYAIYLLHRQFENMLAMEVISIPNGKLHPIYGDDIIQAGKGGYANGNDIRYSFRNSPIFESLDLQGGKRFRVRLIAIDGGLDPRLIISRNYDGKPTFKLTNGKVTEIR